MRLPLTVLFASLLFSGPALGGWLEDTVVNAMKGVAERGIDDAANGAYEQGKEAVKKSPRKRARDDASDGADSSPESDEGGADEKAE